MQVQQLVGKVSDQLCILRTMVECYIRYILYYLSQPVG